MKHYTEKNLNTLSIPKSIFIFLDIFRLVAARTGSIIYDYIYLPFKKSLYSVIAD